MAIGSHLNDFVDFCTNRKGSTQFPGRGNIEYLFGGEIWVQVGCWPGHLAKANVARGFEMAPFSYSKYLLFGLPVVVVAGLATLWWERKEKRRSYKEVGRVSDLFILFILFI